MFIPYVILPLLAILMMGFGMVITIKKSYSTLSISLNIAGCLIIAVTDIFKYVKYSDILSLVISIVFVLMTAYWVYILIRVKKLHLVHRKKKVPKPKKKQIMTTSSKTENNNNTKKLSFAPIGAKENKPDVKKLHH